MGEVINLNQYRKQRERQEKKKSAAVNRIRFGRRKDEVSRSKVERERERAEHDGKVLRDHAETDDAPEAG